MKLIARFAAAALLLGAASSLTSCGVPPPDPVSERPVPTAPQIPSQQRPVGGVEAIEDRVILEGARALTIAAIAYEGAVMMLSPLVDAGAIRGNTAASVQTYNRMALEALTAGYQATSDADKARYAASALRWVERIRDIAGIKLPFGLGAGK